MDSGKSVFEQFPHQSVHKKGLGHTDAGNGGGNSGAVISPAPKLGLSAYQDPNVKVRPLPRRQGGS